MENSEIEMQIAPDFAYLKVTEDEAKIMKSLEQYASELLRQIREFCPDGRYKSLARTKLGECVMFAKKSISHKGIL